MMVQKIGYYQNIYENLMKENGKGAKKYES